MECTERLARSHWMLRPHLVRPRARHWLALAIVTNAGVWIAIAARPDSTTIFSPSFTVTAPPPAPAPPPPPIVVMPMTHGPSCPPARTDAPFVAPKFDEDIDHVQAAPTNAGWIAAWNEHHVFVSRDAGATFQRVLDGDGKVFSTSFDCWGHVLVARGNQLGVRDGNDEQWKPLPSVRSDDDSPRAVIGGGPDVVLVGRAPGDEGGVRAAISGDGGATWRYHDLHGGTDGERIRGRQHEDGAIDIAYSLGDCMSDDVYSARIANGVVSEDEYTIAEGSEFTLVDGTIFTDGGWRAPKGEWQSYPSSHWAAPIPNSAVIVNDDKTYRFAHGKLREIPVIVEGTPQAVDPAGRIWSVACGQVLVAKKTPTGIPATCQGSD